MSNTGTCGSVLRVCGKCLCPSRRAGGRDPRLAAWKTLSGLSPCSGHRSRDGCGPGSMPAGGRSPRSPRRARQTTRRRGGCGVRGCSGGPATPGAPACSPGPWEDSPGAKTLELGPRSQRQAAARRWRGGAARSPREQHANALAQQGRRLPVMPSDAQEGRPSRTARARQCTGHSREPGAVRPAGTTTVSQMNWP